MLQATAVEAPTTMASPPKNRMPVASFETKPGSPSACFFAAGRFERFLFVTTPAGVGLSETSKSSGGALTVAPWMLGRVDFTVLAPFLPERASPRQRLGGFC